MALRSDLAFRPLVAVALVALALLAGCKSNEEEAADLFKSAQALRAENKLDDAVAQLQQSLDLDQGNVAARVALGEIYGLQGRAFAATAQYKAALERQPDSLPARLGLGEIALAAGDDATADSQYGAIAATAADDPRAQALKLALDFDRLTTTSDPGTRDNIVVAARAILAAHPEVTTARRVIVKALMQGSTPADALPEIDAALAITPNDISFDLLKLDVLRRLGDVANVGAELKHLYAAAPDNVDIQNQLLDWYRANGPTEEGVVFLRDIAKRNKNDKASLTQVVDFLHDREGSDAAAAELYRLAAAPEGRDFAADYLIRAANLDVAARRDDRAKAALVAATKTLPADQVQRVRMKLAQILSDEGDRPAATKLVDQALAANPNDPDALALSAAWNLDDNKPDVALSQVRVALASKGNDADLLLLMARAYEASGQATLATRSYVEAQNVSGNAVPVTLKLYRYLIRTGHADTADTVLGTALVQHPDDVSLLLADADAAIMRMSWRVAAADIEHLRRIGTKESLAAATTLEPQLKRRKAAADTLFSLIDDAPVAGDAPAPADLAGLRAQIESGDLQRASRSLAVLGKRFPGAELLRKLSDGVTALQADRVATD